MRGGQEASGRARPTLGRQHLQQQHALGPAEGLLHLPRVSCPVRFNKQLKDNWGLETLVSVGESWLPAMLEQDEVGCPPESHRPPHEPCHQLPASCSYGLSLTCGWPHESWCVLCGAAGR